ncbi:hypothetical protein OAN13_03845 [Opitutales bacterium]|nr:hypothetical protein [Opitutales bacterium]
MALFFRFILILTCFEGLGLSIHGQDTVPDSLKNRLIVIDPLASPTLEYYCLQESFFYESLLNPNPVGHPMEFIARISLDSSASINRPPLRLSTISSSSISDWMLGNYFDSIEISRARSSFLFEESEKIEQFFEKDREKGLLQLAIITKEIRDRNFTAQMTSSTLNKNVEVKSKQEEEGFGKFALYMLIAGGVFSIYAVMAPAGGSTQGNDKAEKIELARRKRWLEKIRQKGWIDRTTYHFLLKKIDDLPTWLGGIKPPDQSTGTETSVDLSKRKSGESVVITKDTSEDKTSR